MLHCRALRKVHRSCQAHAVHVQHSVSAGFDRPSRRPIHILEAPDEVGDRPLPELPLVDEVTEAQREIRRGRPRQAEQLLVRAADILAPVFGADSAAVASVHEGRYEALMQLGRFDDAQAVALQLLSSAKRRLPQPPSSTVTASSASTSSSPRPVAPSAAAAAAADDEVGGRDDRWQQRATAELHVASSLRRLVRAYRAQGKWHEAVGFAGELVALFRRRLDAGGLGSALLEMANVRLLESAAAAATATTTVGAEGAPAAGGGGDEGRAAAELLQQTLAVVEEQPQGLVDAVGTSSSSSSLSQQLVAVVKARALNNIGVHAWRLGATALAEDFLRAAEHAASSDPQTQSDVLFNLSDLLLLLSDRAGAVETAQELLERSLKLAEQQKQQQRKAENEEQEGQEGEFGSLAVAIRLHMLATSFMRQHKVVYAEGLLKRTHQMYLQLPFQYLPPERRSSGSISSGGDRSAAAPRTAAAPPPLPLVLDASASLDAFQAAFVDFLLSQSRNGEAGMVCEELDKRKQQQQQQQQQRR